MSNIPTLKNFQEKAVNEILGPVELILNDTSTSSRRKVILDSPTGSGKTRIIADIITRGLPEALTIVLSPGKGELEQQTHNALKLYLSDNASVNVKDMDIPLFQNAAAPGTVVVQNWERLATRKKETGKYSVNLTKDGDNNNLFDWVTASAKTGVPVAIIIDEAHYGNSKNAPAIQNFLLDITQAVKAGGGAEPVVIEASATPILNEFDDLRYYCTVDREEVVEEGLMRRRGILNDGVEDVIARLEDPISVSAENVLLTGALDKSNELNAEYRKVGSKQHSLIAVQIPNSTPGKEAQERVIKFFDEQGMTVENGQVVVFLADSKTGNIDDISSPDSPIRVLIYKQAITTGWDCPRAQVLVGFRHINSLIFSAQNLGRFSRATEARHYTLEESPTSEKLNNFYVYSNISDMGLGYHPSRIKDGSALPLQTLLPGDVALIDEFNAYNLPISSLVRGNQGMQNEAVIGRLLKMSLVDHDYTLSPENLKGILLHTGSVKTVDLLDEAVEEDSFNAITSQIGRASHEITARWNDLIMGTINDFGGLTNKGNLANMFSRRLLTFYTARLRSEGASQEELFPLRVIARLSQRENYEALEKVILHVLAQDELAVLKESYEKDPEASFPASARRFRFGGSFGLANTLLIDRLDKTKVSNGLASKFIYREEDDRGASSSWRQETLSGPEASFEKFCLEFTASNLDWELAGIQKNSPYANHQNFSLALSVLNRDEDGRENEVTLNFFPDYIVFLRNAATGETFPIVVEVKGSNPESLDRGVKAKALAAKSYSEKTGLPFIIALQKEQGSETFRVYGENMDFEDYLETVKYNTITKFPKHEFGSELPAELDWMKTLGRTEE